MKNDSTLKKCLAAKEGESVTITNDNKFQDKIPDGWWMNNSSCCLLLAVFVHRTNPDPDIVSDTTAIPTETTQESICDSTDNETAARIEREKIVKNHGTVIQRLEESMMSSKGVVHGNVGQKLLNCYPLRVFSSDQYKVLDSGFKITN
jgi:hypothetical protein